MKKISGKKIVPIGLAAIIVLSMFAATIPMASAICNNGSVNVAFVPDTHGGGGGWLPTTHPAFSGFTFTDVPTTSVNAATLANYDTVVMTVCNPMSRLSTSQLSDIVNWTAAGGKLIIYDSECASGGATLNYTWLPCGFTVFYPGAWGATQSWYSWVNLTIVENNTLSDNNTTSPYFINTTKIAWSTDAAGDQNVFIANESCWCGDMIGTNVLNATGSPVAPGTTGFSHAYFNYTKGLIIYNGLDIDPLRTNSDPTANTAVGHFAKIWLLELNQKWDNINGNDSCGLPCRVIIVPPVPPVIEVDVDIKPGSCPNPLNVKSKGVLPVAVLGTEDFDVTTIDPTTILLNQSCCVGCEGVAPIRWDYEDVATPFTGALCDCHNLTSDGYMDLTLKFDTRALVSALVLVPGAGNVTLTLTGNLTDGTAIEGKDCIFVL